MDALYNQSVIYYIYTNQYGMNSMFVQPHAEFTMVIKVWIESGGVLISKLCTKLLIKLKGNLHYTIWDMTINTIAV